MEISVNTIVLTSIISSLFSIGIILLILGIYTIYQNQRYGKITWHNNPNNNFLRFLDILL